MLMGWSVYRKTIVQLYKGNSQKKLKDPSSFTISCIILGASINLMPFLVAKNLNLGEITLTSLSLQIADRSMDKSVC